MQEKEEDKLFHLLDTVTGLDTDAQKQSGKKWNAIAKPLYSLGKLEYHVMQIAGITGNAEVSVQKKALIVMCADNGVVEEGVTQTGQEVTAIVAENFLSGNTSAAIMCRKAGVDLFPIDIGMAVDTKVPGCKIRYGTANLAKEPAMTREEAVRAVLAGIRIVKEKKEAGYDILATGEMGIGNTTTSSAIASVLLHTSVEQMTGRGAGLTSKGLQRKVQVIRQAVALHHPDPADPFDVLAKVGGLDIAGLTGVYLGCAVYRLPVVIDGFIAAVAALAAARLQPLAKEYMIASHVSKEPGMQIVLEELGLSPSLTCDMCLGEGTGAVAYLPVLEMAVEVYQKMSTFSDNQIDAYEELV